MNRTLILFLSVAFCVLGSLTPQVPVFVTQDAAAAQQGWRQEYEDICAKTQDAMALSTEELSGLIARCDALKPVIEQLEETQKKVYLKRLQMCRDLYFFVLESKKK